MVDLYPHQKAAIIAAEEHRAKGHKAGLWAMPTGCVAGDTVIGINRAGIGYSRQIARMAKGLSGANPGRTPRSDIPTMVRSYLPNEQRIGLHVADGIVASGERQIHELVVVGDTFDWADKRNLMLRATADHLILTENGWVPLAELSGTDRVMCQAPRPAGRKHHKLVYRQVQGLKYHPFVGRVKAKRRRGNYVEGRLYRVPYHRLVIEAHRNGISVEALIRILRTSATDAERLSFLDPEQLAVHHRDGDVTNNRLGNLEVLSHPDHLRRHGKNNTHNFGLMEVTVRSVLSVQKKGLEPTYDVQCADPIHNFVANGIIVHNSGKSYAFLSLAKGWRARTLVMVHRDELIRQTVRSADVIWPDAVVGVVQAERDEWRDGLHGTPDLVVASVPSLHARRLEQIPNDRFGLVISDEAHHSSADIWKRVLDHFEPDFLLGCTATPERADGKDLSRFFGEKPIYVYPLRQAIEDGVLCRLTQYAIETSANLDKVATRKGDFARDQLGHAVNTNERNRCIVEAWQKHAAQRLTLAFCVNLEHMEGLRWTFKKAGVVVDSVSGDLEKEDRRDRLARFADGRTRVMTSVGVLTEGYDNPAVNCALMARPTQSRPLYIQMIGRSLRRHPGKKDTLILDITDNCRRHSLVTALDLMGSSGKTRDNEGGDVVATVDEERRQAVAVHELPRQDPLSWRLTRICPWPDMPTLAGYSQKLEWQIGDATESQRRYLMSFGVKQERNLSKGEASWLIDRCWELQGGQAEPNAQPATYKQEWYLKKQNAWRDGLTKQEASRRIGQLKRRQLQGVTA